MPTPLTGAQYEIFAGDYVAVITELGAGLRALHCRGVPLIDGYEANQVPPGGAGQLLSPWPNRVAGGRYAFGGQQFQLDLSEPAAGNAIHGLTRWANWVPARQETNLVQLRHVLLGRPGYPFCLELQVRYALDPQDGLAVQVSAANPGSRPAPYGTGCHPYLTTGADRVDDCELALPASLWQPAGLDGMPAGAAQDVGGSPLDFRPGRLIGGQRLDHAFTGLDRDRDGRATALLSGAGRGVLLWAGPGYRWLQVFTGDTLPEQRRRRAVAVEPMTCPPDALATGTDLLVLEPGDSVSHAWGIREAGAVAPPG